MENEQIVIQIKAGIDVAENMLQLWEQNRGYIRKIASRFNGYECLEDLEQEGYIGLCHAVDAYDQDGGASFITYADYWIKNTIMRYIEDCGQAVRVPNDMAGKLRKSRKIRERFRQQFGREPSDWELQQSTGFNRNTLKRLQDAERAGTVGSLDSPVKSLEDEDATIGDTIPGETDVEKEVLESIQSQELKETLWPMVDGLPGQLGPVLRMSYQEELQSPEVGERLGILAADAQKLKKRGIQELRKVKEPLRPFLFPDAATYNAALRGGSLGSFNRTWTSSTERTALENMKY